MNLNTKSQKTCLLTQKVTLKKHLVAFLSFSWPTGTHTGLISFQLSAHFSFKESGPSSGSEDHSG